MDGLIGKIRATPGNRDALARALVDEVGDMPGCLSYVISVDPDDADGVWVAEAWESADHHHAWLKSAAARALVAHVGPLMVGYVERHDVRPVGGLGIPQRTPGVGSSPRDG